MPVKAHDDCLGCGFRGENTPNGLLCRLHGGVKAPEAPCPDPKLRDLLAKGRREMEVRAHVPV